MQTAIPSAATLANREKKPTSTATFPPLESITKPTVDTEAAAFFLNRRPQTLRCWALTGYPIAPVRCNGRLAWKVADIKALLEVA